MCVYLLALRLTYLSNTTSFVLCALAASRITRICFIFRHLFEESMYWKKACIEESMYSKKACIYSKKACIGQVALDKWPPLQTPTRAPDNQF